MYRECFSVVKMTRIIVGFVLSCAVLRLSVTQASRAEYLHQEAAHCKHEHPKVDEVVRGVHIEPAHVVRRRSIDQQLRIAVFYDHSVYRLDADKFDLINDTILPEAVKYWERTLTVRKTADVIRLNRRCSSRDVFLRLGKVYCINSCKLRTTCGDVVVPENHLNPCLVCNATGHECTKLPRGQNSLHGIRDHAADEEGELEPDTDNDADSNGTMQEVRFGTTGIGGALPNEGYGVGVADADFVLYVSAVDTERCRRGSTVAYAAHCQQESALDRPIAGHANFCPTELRTGAEDADSLLATVKHEMLHALGFSVSLFAFYRDDNGDPLTPRRSDIGSPPIDEDLQVHSWSEKVVRSLSRPKWLVRGGYVNRTVHMIVTPRVVKAVREHFNCSTLEGAELEDQGGEGTALTHWEKRIFENEAMTGTHTPGAVFSPISLALMEDTGWYRADYGAAAGLTWGRGRGCAFATASCKEWISSKSIKGARTAPWCSRIKKEPLRTSCSAQRQAVTLCNLVRHERPLPLQYQHFDYLPDIDSGEESYYGGAVTLADYCPYLQEFTWRHKGTTVRGSKCTLPENTPKADKNFALEDYGSRSLCFDHSNHMWEQRSCRQVRQWQHWGSGCYEHKCKDGRLSIVVDKYKYTCLFAGQEIWIRIVKGGWLHKGAIICPPCSQVCGARFKELNQTCLPGEEPLPSNMMPRDDLACDASHLRETYYCLILPLLLVCHNLLLLK